MNLCHRSIFTANCLGHSLSVSLLFLFPAEDCRKMVVNGQMERKGMHKGTIDNYIKRLILAWWEKFLYTIYYASP